MDKKLLQRILVVVFGLAFVGSTGAVIIGSLLRKDTSVANSPVAETVSPLEQLQAQAKGYEKVLAREPNNINALTSLVQIRLQTGDLEGAIAPLDKLVEMYPEDTNLVALKAQIKQELEKRSNESEETIPEPEDTTSKPEN
ncbi:MAG: tetratricopeptide repeat protein [Xenococcus sp. MO_188.B8]|nr:tetratricopeptide repeat protein [Xenococcus sp. MO_188.B8]